MGLPGDTRGFETAARCPDTPSQPMMLTYPSQGGEGMKAKNWRHMLYVGATLATFLLAAGAKFKN